MDFVDHYRRAEELAEQLDKALGQTAYSPEARELAAVLAQACNARAMLAWTSLMGADVLAAQRLVEDVRAWQAPTGDDLPDVITLQDPARRARRGRGPNPRDTA